MLALANICKAVDATDFPAFLGSRALVLKDSRTVKMLKCVEATAALHNFYILSTLYVVSKSVLYGAYKTLLYPGVLN